MHPDFLGADAYEPKRLLLVQRNGGRRGAIRRPRTLPREALVSTQVSRRTFSREPLNGVWGCVAVCFRTARPQSSRAMGGPASHQPWIGRNHQRL